MTVEVEHVLYADDVQAAAAIMDNARQSGADEIRATLDKRNNVWRVEYKIGEEEST